MRWLLHPVWRSRVGLATCQGRTDREDRGVFTPACRPGLPIGKGDPVESFDTLKKLIEGAEEDIRKAEGGNKAAGTRARQTMQDIKNAAQEVRQKILELRGDAASGDADKGAAKTG
jgi:hypothetical protein